MPRYGDLDALKESFHDSYKKLQEIYKELSDDEGRAICEAQLVCFAEAILRTKNAPTADVVEVVRCKDCVNSRELNRNDPYENMYFEWCVWCNMHGFAQEEDFYCSDGERRNDG